MQPDDLVPATEIAEWLDLHERQVRKFAERGVVERDGRGRYRLKQTVRLIHVHVREQAAGRLGSGDADNPDLPLERALLARSQREGQDLRNAVLRGDLVSLQDWEDVFGRLVDVVRANYLAMPHKIAPLLVGLNKPHEIQAVLTRAVHEVLTELAATRIAAASNEVAQRARTRVGGRWGDGANAQEEPATVMDL